MTEEKTAYTSGELFGGAIPSDIKKIFDKPEEKTFCQLLKEAIEDEGKAGSMYQVISEKASLESLKTGSPISPAVVLIIESIKRDEEKHKELEEKLKTLTCRSD